MTRHPILVALCFFALLPPLWSEEEAAEGQAVFANGDKLSGTPGAMTDKGLLWSAKHLLHQPSTIKVDSLLEVRLPGGPTRPDEADHQALLKLTNGDTIRGELAALSDEFVTLRTWYSGELQVKRTMAEDLEIIRSERTLFSGPTNINNWTQSGRGTAWSVSNGRLLSRGGGSVAREVDLPEKCRVSFDLAWRSSLKFRLLLFSDEGDTITPDNCYDLVCQRQFIYLRKKWSTGASGGTRTIGQPANIRQLANQEKVRLDLYVDRKTGTIGFYVDGQQTNVWTDDDPKLGNFGKWIHFVSEEYPLRISNIRASVWTGDLPENADDEKAEDAIEEKGQIILLQNGDTIIGEVGDIKDGILTVASEYGEIPVPVQRMRALDLTGDDYEEPIRKNGDVRAWLKEGGRITFRLDSFKDGKMQGYCQSFGEATFDLDAFSRLEFNIYNENFDGLREDTE